MLRGVCVACWLTLIIGARAEVSAARTEAVEFVTSAAPVVLAHRGELAARVERMAVQQGCWLLGLLHPWDQDPDAFLLTRGGSGEHDIRPNAHTAFGLAVFARTLSSDVKTTLTRKICRDRAIAILRFLLATHRKGGQRCADGKQWYGQWQSALWASTAGKAAWLLWDDLDPEMRGLAGRMICDEADRFLTMTPPCQVVSDTKSEENAWNSTVIVLAYNMFPNHPRHKEYREAAVKWTLSSYLRKADLESTRIVDGKALRDWNLGANIHDDYTLENHHRVHPDYMNSMIMLLWENLLYEWGGNRVPDANSMNLCEIYGVLKKMTMPDGGYVYPNGQDWALHRNPQWIETHACMAAFHGDPDGARLLRVGIDTAERMLARQPHGPIHLESEHNFASTQHLLLDMFANVYLVLASRGEGPDPTPERELWKSLSGVHQFDAGKFAIIRSTDHIATFSWGQRLMGMVMPLQKDLLLSPNENSLAGMVRGEGLKDEAPRIREVKAKTLRLRDEDVFTAVGVADRADGSIEQRFAFISSTKGQTSYVDMWRGDDRTATATLDLGLISVLNDPNWVYHDGTRGFGSSLQEEMDISRGDPRPQILEIDGVMSVAVLGANGETFFPEKTAPFRGRVEQNVIVNRVGPDVWRKGHPATGPFTACTGMVFLIGNSLATPKSLVGRVLSVDGNTIKMKNADVTDEIDWEALEVQRFDSMGRRVF